MMQWQYPRGPPTQPVHAFSNIKVDSNVFPVEISKVSTINFETEWYYGVGNDRPTAVDVAALTAVQLDANVAVDMFLDSDPTKATDVTQAKYEVMIWFAQYGASTQQIGLAEGAIANQVVNGTTFELFSGVNGVGQSVLSWVASTAATGVTEFTGDIGILLQGLTGLGGPTVNGMLGHARRCVDWVLIWLQITLATLRSDQKRTTRLQTSHSTTRSSRATLLRRRDT
jgi:hypothetical protein